jgi:signal transduction histidine kinase
MASIGFKIRGMSGRLTTFLLTASVWLLLAGSSATAGEDSLTNAAAIVGSTLAKGDEPPPVDLEAIVTHRDATGTIFLRDETGATFIVSDQKTPVLPAGERVRVAGVVHRGLFINGIRHAGIERLGGGPRPEPKPITPQQLAAGGMHYEWVSIEGMGRGWRTTEDGGGTLTVNVADGVVETRLEQGGGDATAARWIGARVRVQGIAAGEINDRRQLIRPYLLVPTVDDIAVIEPAPSDPFAIPETSVSGLGRGEPLGRLQRVAGVAVAAPRGERLFLFDGHNGLCVALADAEQGASIKAGDRVEAAGFAEPGTFATRMAEARVRVVATGAPVAPRRPSAAELRSGCDGQLVELEMTVVDRDDWSEGTTLACEFQGIAMRVVVPQPLAATIVPAATVRVTAPCLVTDTTDDLYSLKATAYDLFPARVADVVAIRRPSWWTARRLGILLAGSLAAVAAAVGWIVLLRRQVRRQLAVIEEKIHAEAVAEERRRIAREFHDSLEQDLSGLALRIDSAAGSTADPEARRVMERQREIIARLRDETRQYVWDLRDPARLRGSLADRVESLLGELRDVHATPIALEPTGPLPSLPPETIHHLLQMLREAVSNAARHSQARRISVALREESGGVVASVTDDGIGFDAAAGSAPAGHFGLRGLTERARRIGASAAIESRPGVGTTVTIRLPA